MRSMRPPGFAQWLLKNFGCSPNNEAVIGDLNEQLSTGHSRMWHWRQVLIAIIVSVSKDIWTHKLLALRGLWCLGLSVAASTTMPCQYSAW